MATKAPASAGMTPNFTQSPNLLVDEVLRFLDHRAGESAVLTVLIRQTYGWHKPVAAVSTTYMARLTGLNRHTCAKAVDALVEYGIAVKVSDNDPAANIGASYGLQLDESKIEIPALRERWEKAKAKRSLSLSAMRERQATLALSQPAPTDEPGSVTASPLAPSQPTPLALTQPHKRNGKETEIKAPASRGAFVDDGSPLPGFVKAKAYAGFLADVYMSDEMREAAHAVALAVGMHDEDIGAGLSGKARKNAREGWRNVSNLLKIAGGRIHLLIEVAHTYVETGGVFKSPASLQTAMTNRIMRERRTGQSAGPGATSAEYGQSGLSADFSGWTTPVEEGELE